jgi:hypothetical protein
MRNLHTELVDRILRHLSFYVKDGFFWLNNTGGAWVNGHFIKYGKKGSADIIGCFKGRFVAIEAKTGKGVQHKGQIEFERKICAAGGFYTVARTVDDALSFLSSIGGSNDT